ncbi:MAG: hypothetical protein U9R60_13025 [Bacteroidota bacterium]|nr:hypothetical protein [Bacteroidota bacterium]
MLFLNGRVGAPKATDAIETIDELMINSRLFILINYQDKKYEIKLEKGTAELA